MSLSKPGTRTVAYLRVSTEKQAEEGVSLAIQRSKVCAYAEAYDLELVEVVEDPGVSGKSMDRPGLQRALAMLEKGEADALLVMKLDRLTRRVADLGVLIEAHFSDDRRSLISVSEHINTGTAAGRLVLNVLVSVSQWERETISERVSQSMKHLKEAGRYTGGIAPYGWRPTDDGGLVPHEAEQTIIQAVQGYRDAGLSFKAIAERLSERGRKTRKGHTRWSPSMAHRVSKARAA